MSLVMHLVWNTRKTQSQWCIRHTKIEKHTTCSPVKISWTSTHSMVKQIVFHNLELWNCNIVGTEAVFRFHIYLRDHMSVFFCPTGPRDKRPYPSPRFSWSYPSNPWHSGSFFPVSSFKDTCNPDLTFDAVTTVGEAIFFFRDKWVDHV